MKAKIYFIMGLLLFSICVFAQTEGEGESLTDILLGGMSVNYFIAMVLYALVGAIVNKAADVTKRNVPSDRSPKKFSFSYWWKDNKRKAIADILLVPVAIVCCNEFFNMEITTGSAFAIGFGSDYLLAIAKKRKMKLLKGYDLTEADKN